MFYERTQEIIDSLKDLWADLQTSLGSVQSLLEPGDLQTTFGTMVEECGQAMLEIDHAKTDTAVHDSIDKSIAWALGVLNSTRGHYNNVARTFKTRTAVSLGVDAASVADCRARLQELFNYITRERQELEELGDDKTIRRAVQGIQGAVQDVASYPMLTTDLGGMISLPSGGGGGAGAGGQLPLQRIVENALRDVLGRVPRLNDTRSFVAALRQSFDIREVEGHTEFSWNPRALAGTSELGGGITGAQASLFARAQVAVEQSLDMLDTLYPLVADPDWDEVRAAQAILRSQLGELLKELGREGGPRIERVDQQFVLLLDDITLGIDNIAIKGGKLGYLQSVLGLFEGEVNTLEEEADVTNFLTIQDYVTSLRTSWETFRDQFYGRDLGTRLVFLARAFSVVSDAVDEAAAAMDSVFISDAERNVIEFNTSKPIATGGQAAPRQKMVLGDLLSWIQDYASSEAPDLVRDGGRRGISMVVPTAKLLADLVYDLLAAIRTDPRLPDGIRHPRVRHPLQEMASYLNAVAQLGEDVRNVRANFPNRPAVKSQANSAESEVPVFQLSGPSI